SGRRTGHLAGFIAWPFRWSEPLTRSFGQRRDLAVLLLVLLELVLQAPQAQTDEAPGARAVAAEALQGLQDVPFLELAQALSKEAVRRGGVRDVRRRAGGRARTGRGSEGGGPGPLRRPPAE